MSKLSEFEVLKILGTGSNGTCYKVRNKLSGEIFAWKAIDYGQLSDKQKDLVITEINLLSELSEHSVNIVKYYDKIINKTTKTLYIIMECCDGGDLLNLIKKCKTNKCHFEEEFIWRVLYQLAQALHLLHSPSSKVTILHRDIKPANVFLDLNGNVKLGDFGLSRILNENENFAETLVGTPYYMSPELIKGNKYNRKSDIWSLGCLIYELCALVPPFNGNRFEQLSKNITNGQFNRIPSIYSCDLQQIITFMLSVDHEYRPTIEVILHHPTVVSNQQASSPIIGSGYPCLMVDNQNSVLFNPNPELSSTIQINSNLSVIQTPALRDEIFGSVRRRIFPESEIFSDPGGVCVKNCGVVNGPIRSQSDNVLRPMNRDDPNQITQDVFTEALKNRLIAIKSRESELKKREDDLKEKELNFMKKEKRLKRHERIPSKIRAKRVINLQDSCLTIEPNETVMIPTVAKFDPKLIPKPKILQNRVAFKSPQKFKNYNIENIPPSSPLRHSMKNGNDHKRWSTMKYSQKDLENAVIKNYDTISNAFNGLTIPSTITTTTTVAAEAAVKANKRKSIFSIFSLNTNKKVEVQPSTIKLPPVVLNGKEEEFNDQKSTISKTETTVSTEVASKWNHETKKAAFEMLALLNSNEHREKDVVMIDDKIIRHDRKRRSMFLYRKSTNM